MTFKVSDLPLPRGRVQRGAEAFVKHGFWTKLGSLPGPTGGVSYELLFPFVATVDAPKSTGLVLTDEQEALVRRIREFVAADPVQPAAGPGALVAVGDKPMSNVLVVHGPAGSGKTTVVARVLRELAESSGVRFLALTFTHKAADVLRSKGLAAQTIQSALLFPPRGLGAGGGDDDWELHLERAERIHNEYDVILVDECSMVSRKFAQFIAHAAKRVIAIGDPMQLLPVSGEPLWGLPGTADVALTRSIRFEDGSEIARLANAVRMGAPPEVAFKDSPALIPEAGVDWGAWDVAITLTNSDRWELVRRIRGDLSPPKPGDIIQMRTNQPAAGIFNRLTFTVVDVLGGDELHHHLVVGDRTGSRRELRVLAGGFRSLEEEVELTKRQRNAVQRVGDDWAYAATWAQALTVHSSQGSEFDRVLFLVRASNIHNPQHGLVYTAITRARHELGVVVASS